MLLGLLDGIEFFLVLLEGNGNGDVRVGSLGAVYLRLDSIVNTLAIFLGGLLALHVDSLANVLAIRTVDQHSLIIFLLILSSLKVKLLDLFAPQIHLDLYHLILCNVELSLAHSLTLASLFALQERVLQLLTLAFIGLLAGLYTINLLLTLFFVPTFRIMFIIYAFLITFLCLVPFQGVLLEKFNVLVCVFLSTPLEFITDFTIRIIHHCQSLLFNP